MRYAVWQTISSQQYFTTTKQSIDEAVYSAHYEFLKTLIFPLPFLSHFRFKTNVVHLLVPKEILTLVFPVMNHCQMKKNDKKERTALSSFHFDFKHDFDFDNTEIVD